MGVALGLALLLIAALFWIWGLRLRRTTGLPWAPVLAQDTYGPALEKPLFARRLGLTGKPDYLLDIRGATIPVEVKPGRRAARPYESDLMQLAAYCVLVEETSGDAPPYGLLRYAERTFRLDYTAQVRDELLDLLDEMRALLDDDDCERSHDDPRRCAGCGFFEQCDDALEAGDAP
ncbi:MAG TPA: Dna2/Cas4 domain-containing protein [Roseiflexaceae bacterium]|nr:Dna2/Cas4 domain-containing protein [Roseiflexaceae bacterium]